MYLEEHLAKDPVRLLAEYSAEDDGDTIRRSLNVYRLLVAVMNLHKLAFIASALLKLFLLRECALKGRSKSIAFQKGKRLDERVALLYSD